MNAASSLFHLLGALRRAVVRVILFGLLFLIIGIALIEGLAFIVGSRPYTPALITHITAVIAGIILAYAAALTVLATEAIKALVDAIREVEGGVKAEVGDGVKIFDRVIQLIEKI
jgi:uncharacterized membrane protein (DUF106 family)